jgi:transcriptional regulator with XRE-family HTH domain
MPGHKSDDAKDHRAFGRALRELRQQATLTQEQLAARVGIGATYLSQIENGHRGARWHTVMRLLRALDATLADLGDAIVKAERTDPPPKR